LQYVQIFAIVMKVQIHADLKSTLSQSLSLNWLRIRMKPEIVVASALLLASCATAGKPEDWVRVDRAVEDQNITAAAIADCHAQAVLAGQQYGNARPIVLAQFSPKDYEAVPPPASGSYQAPMPDFSVLSRQPNSHGFIAKQQLIQSVMDSCMAQKGYIRRGT
jgi:hypothetical protein